MFDGEHPPITTEHLGVLPGARLDQRDWQVLLDDSPIIFQIPEVIPEREPEQEPDPEIPKPMASKGDLEQQGVTIGQMETSGKTIFEKITKDMKHYLKELGSDLSADIKDVERKMGYHLDDLDKRLKYNIVANRERSAELSTQIKKTQMGVNDILKRFPPEYSSTCLPGDTFPHLRFLEAEDSKPPFQLDITGDPQ